MAMRAPTDRRIRRQHSDLCRRRASEAAGRSRDRQPGRSLPGACDATARLPSARSRTGTATPALSQTEIVKVIGIKLFHLDIAVDAKPMRVAGRVTLGLQVDDIQPEHVLIDHTIDTAVARDLAGESGCGGRI